MLWTATALAQPAPEEVPPDGAASPPPADVADDSPADDPPAADPPSDDSPADEMAPADEAPPVEAEPIEDGEAEPTAEERPPGSTDEVLVVEPADEQSADAEVALEEARAAVARAEAALERIRRAEEAGEEVDPADAAAAADAEALLIVWHGLRGKSIAARITALEDFVRHHLNSRYAVVMYEEAAALRELLSRRSSPEPEKTDPAKGLSLYQVSFSAPKVAPAGQAFDVVVELNRLPKGPVSFQLRRGWADFETHPMRRIGDRHYAFRVPAREVVYPGVAFYIDVDEGGEKARAVVGGRTYPHHVEVKTELVEKAAQQPIVEGWAKGEYADVNHFNGDDYLLRAWGAGSVRFGDLGLRRASLGYTFTHVITADHAWLDHGPGFPYEANFGAALIELEFAPDEYFSLVARPIIGRAGNAAAGGFRGGLRAGSDLGTNFLIACEGVVGWGMLGIAQLEIQEIELVPITIRLEMSNQASAQAPLDDMSSGLWGRGIIEVGYRFHPSFEASGRVSVQGRGEEHAGAGLGGGVKVRW